MWFYSRAQTPIGEYRSEVLRASTTVVPPLVSLSSGYARKYVNVKLEDEGLQSPSFHNH